MLWNVNNGGGYPFPNGTDIAKYTTASDFKLLDTNGDGSITQADDPYAPYYPVSPQSSCTCCCLLHVLLFVAKDALHLLSSLGRAWMVVSGQLRSTKAVCISNSRSCCSVYAAYVNV